LFVVSAIHLFDKKMDDVQTQILGLITHTLGDTKARFTLGVKVEKTWGQLQAFLAYYLGKH
jgi:hypothetical protein